MTRLHVISCAVDGKVLVEHIPLTIARLGLPLSEVQFTLDLSGSPDVTEIAELFGILSTQRTRTTWLMVFHPGETQGWRCHGTITRCGTLRTEDDRTTLVLVIHLLQADTLPPP